MALLFHSPDEDAQAWRDALLRRMPELEVRLWPEIGDPGAIEAALVWRAPPGLLASLPNLRLILSLGAGVDAMLGDPTLPDLPLCWLVDPSLTRMMGEFVLTLVLKYHRQLDRFALAQREGRWSFALPPQPGETSVGILGLGELGSHAARLLHTQGFAVRGWSRSRREIEGVASFAGPEELPEFLAGSDVLVCLLPLTDATRGILDAGLFAGLPRRARLINVGRGAHLAEDNLVAALDSGQLAHASVDCFAAEPLPPGHPFWRHPLIDVTPHVASFALPESAAEGVVDNLRRLRAGLPLRNLVDRVRGY
jgi:glyoxylate/hydroxypyruvate reductase A